MLTANLPQEHFIRLRINDDRVVTLICTNASLRELITGYLYNEGIIAAAKDILRLEIAPDGKSAEVQLTRPDMLPLGEVRSSGLGSPQLAQDCAPEPRPLLRRFSEAYIRDCAARMDAQALLYAATGGVHGSALFDGTRMLARFEDVGRHNTLDKLAGDCLLRGIDTSDTLLITTGRVSTDMVRKAGRLRASVIASYSTPTDLAYEAACPAGMTLVAYLKKSPLIVLCGEERILR